MSLPSGHDAPLPLARRIEKIMLGQARPGLLYPPLLFAQAVYSAGAGWKNLMFDRGWSRPLRAPCRVISVGGVTFGGAGKTPMAMSVIRHLSKRMKTGALSRGYGQRAKEPVLVVSDGKTLCAPPPYSADEAYLLAKSLPGTPVATAPDRALGAKTLAERFGLEAIVLDDGFQHRRLHRDLDIVMVDEYVLDPARRALCPLGYLREPAESLARADVAVVLLRREEEKGRMAAYRDEIRRLAGKDIHTASAAGKMTGFVDHEWAAAGPMEGPALAFCGIAAPDGFFRTMEGAGAPLAGRMAFPDHHQYTPEDMDAIIRQAGQAGAKWLVTTEKDAARLEGEKGAGEIKRMLRVARWELELDGFDPGWLGP